MRLVIIFVCILATFPHSSSLPFASAKIRNADDDVVTNTKDQQQQDNTPNEPTTTSVRGAASKVSHTSTSTSFPPSATQIVESFFHQNQNSEDETSLKTLHTIIHEMSLTNDMSHFLQTTRRSLHRHPELMYDLPQTSTTIQKILTELDIPFTTGWANNTHPDIYPSRGGYGIVAHVGTMSEPCIILRADMDGLPILESTDGIDSFKSQSKGKMHACGHDGHVTMLLGAAAVLKMVEKGMKGTVRLVFQPAEEGGAGMKRMVEEGVVRMSPRAEWGFGMHVWPTLPSGTIASRPGPLLAAAETFEITLTGRGGHAAMPHLTIDPIVAASALILNLQTLISRTTSPLDAGVVSVTQVLAGDGGFNVIPEKARLRGTIRALSEEKLLELRGRVGEMGGRMAGAYGCESDIRYSPDYYPPTVNDPALFSWSKTVGARVSSEGVVREAEATMGGEDFAFLAQVIPSTFFFIGQGSGGDERLHVPRTDYGLHHPSFALDESVLPVGVELHVNLALRGLGRVT